MRDDLGDVEVRVVAVEVGERLLVARLEAVVELVGQPLADLFDHVGRDRGCRSPV